MHCPASGAAGTAVGAKTVKALLTGTALRRFEPGTFFFCDDASCPVVYFDTVGRCFDTHEIRVPVWQKEPPGRRPICYCFDESEASIRAELDATGRCDAVARVRGHIVAGRCACELRSPKGTCCLGDLIAAVKRVAGSTNP